MTADDPGPARRPARPCPICRRRLAPPAPFRPFCSARCKQVDLGRWLAGDYAIPAATPEDGAAADGEDC